MRGGGHQEDYRGRMEGHGMEGEGEAREGDSADNESPLYSFLLEFGR